MPCHHLHLTPSTSCKLVENVTSQNRNEWLSSFNKVKCEVYKAAMNRNKAQRSNEPARWLAPVTVGQGTMPSNNCVCSVVAAVFLKGSFDAGWRGCT